ncbi:DUF485 domain-containing protein [Streptomyces sp. NPDC002232]|uniref:DUF485 domain-containing protein n=1 Tax=Streptomyces sp. NPDC002232 TaxID=3364640 RepID=UPI0036B66729
MSVPPPRPDSGPPPYERPHEAAASALQEAPRAHSEARRRFLAVNGAAFLVSAALSGTLGELFATRLAGRMPLGIVLGTLQLAVLLLSSWWYDRTLSRQADPLVDRLRHRAQLVHPSPPQPGPAGTTSRRPQPSQGRRR